MGLNHSPKIVTSNLVLALDAANIKSYPKSGNTYFDISGKGNHFLGANTSTYSSNNNGYYAFSNTVSGDYLISSNSTIALTSQLITVNMWVRVSSHLNFNNFIRCNWVNSGWIMYDYTGGWGFSLAQAGGQYGVITAHNGSTSWTNLTGTYDGSNIKLYVNSIYINSAALVNATIDSGYPIYISNSNDPGSYDIGPVQVYNRALSADEVKQNFNALRGRYGI